MMEEFTYYIQKMQGVLKNDKIQHLLARRKSREFVQQISLSMEEKKDKIDKIKTMIKENKKEVNSKEYASNLLNNLNKAEKAELIMNNEINLQEESFKKRLEEKRSRSRGNSLPQFKLKSKLMTENKFNLDPSESISNQEENKDKVDALSEKRNSIKKLNTTPPKRKSILALNTFGNDNNQELTVENLLNSSSKKGKFRKPNLEINLNAEKIPESSNLVVNEDNINEIFDQEYDQKIESQLIKIWDKAGQHMTEELEKIESEMEKYLDSISDEKFLKTMNINNKYDNELKSLESDVDLTDENNVNTIIYREIISDRENELKNFYLELDQRKKLGLLNLRNKAKEIKNNYEKMNQINKVKSDISQGIRTKIIKSLNPKESLNKKFDFNNISYNSKYLFF